MRIRKAVKSDEDLIKKIHKESKDELGSFNLKAISVRNIKQKISRLIKHFTFFKLSNFKIGKQLVFGHAVILIFFLIIVGFSFLSIRNTNKNALIDTHLQSVLSQLNLTNGRIDLYRLYPQASIENNIISNLEETKKDFENLSQYDIMVEYHIDSLSLVLDSFDIACRNFITLRLKTYSLSDIAFRQVDS